MNLYPYQLEGVKALVSKKRFLLRDEPGLGKTAQLIKAANAIGAKYIQVFCPKSMIITWEREITKWSTGSFTQWHVMNHDQLITKNGSQLIRHWDLVIADESHMYLKNINTKRAKAFFQVIEKAERVWMATATVASRSGEDYFCTLKILLPDMKWNRNQFIKTFCKKIKDPWTYSGYKYEGFQNMEELNKILSVCSLRRTEEEVNLQLPPLTETDMYVTAECPKLDKVATDNIIAGVELSKELPKAYQEHLKAVGLNKIPSVLELLETYPLDKKVVIFCWHKEVAHKLYLEVLKTERRPEIINGQFPDGDDRKKDAFQLGPCNTLILNMQSGGAGITLTAATVGIYVQFPHSVIHWVQSRKRIHRIGSKKPVQIIKLMIEGSIDEDIFSVLTERAKFIKEIEG